nr:MAG TPA: hypothetical protein [Caudoviricetes sp.]
MAVFFFLKLTETPQKSTELFTSPPNLPKK